MNIPFLVSKVPVRPILDSNNTILSLRGIADDALIQVPSNAPTPGTSLTNYTSLNDNWFASAMLDITAAISLGYGEYFDLQADAEAAIGVVSCFLSMPVQPPQGASTILSALYYGVGFRIIAAAAQMSAAVSSDVSSFAASIELQGHASSVAVEAFGLGGELMGPLSNLMVASLGGFTAATLAGVNAAGNALLELLAATGKSGNPVYPTLVGVDLDLSSYAPQTRGKVDLAAFGKLLQGMSINSTISDLSNIDLQGGSVPISDCVTAVFNGVASALSLPQPNPSQPLPSANLKDLKGSYSHYIS